MTHILVNGVLVREGDKFTDLPGRVLGPERK